MKRALLTVAVAATVAMIAFTVTLLAWIADAWGSEA